jgi:predicted lactoylglutathione lyase
MAADITGGMRYRETFADIPAHGFLPARRIAILNVENKARADETADEALKSGGKPFNEPSDMGFMYSRSLQDPDGHNWEVGWMDPERIS